MWSRLSFYYYQVLCARRMCLHGLSTASCFLISATHDSAEHARRRSLRRRRRRQDEGKPDRTTKHSQDTRDVRGPGKPQRSLPLPLRVCLSGGAAARALALRADVCVRGRGSVPLCCAPRAFAGAASCLPPPPLAPTCSLSLDQDLSIVCNRRASAPARVRLS